MNNKIYNPNWICFSVCFIIFVIFYGIIHPLVPFDTDDWMNMNISRPFYPSLECWNPTKVFPECLEPTVAMFAAYFIAPAIGDYVNALILANAIVVSTFITFYLYSVQRLLIDRFDLSKLNSFCIVVFFALIHFIVLKTKETNNDYLWYAEDCNCYYHYIIPNLLCASLVLWLMRIGVKKMQNNWNLAILVFVSFLALCSNLYSTVILIAYIGAILLYDLIIINKGEKNWLINYIKQHSYYLIILVLWLVVQLFEANGIRAIAYGHLEEPEGDLLLTTLKHFVSLKYNLYFIVFFFLTILGAKIYNFYKENHKLMHIGKTQIIISLSFVLSLAYLILLSSKVKPENIQKGEVIFSYAFYILLLLILSIGYLSAQIKSFKILIPLAILLIAFNIRNVRSSFLGVQCLWGTTEYESIENNRDIINQVCLAEALGQDSVSIRIPKYELKDNWPLAFDSSDAVGLTLYKHTVTRRYIKTKFELAE